MNKTEFPVPNDQLGTWEGPQMPSPHFLTPLQPDPCPVPDEILGQLYSSPQHDLAEALSTMPGLQRGRLALFCNRRAHLHEIGLSIAATCTEADLVHEG